MLQNGGEPAWQDKTYTVLKDKKTLDRNKQGRNKGGQVGRGPGEGTQHNPQARPYQEKLHQSSCCCSQVVQNERSVTDGLHLWL